MFMQTGGSISVTGVMELFYHYSSNVVRSTCLAVAIGLSAGGFLIERYSCFDLVVLIHIPLHLLYCYIHCILDMWSSSVPTVRF